MTEALVRITSPYFCAGLVIQDDKAILCAPILRYMRDWDLAHIRAYCARKRWTIEEVEGCH